MQNAEFKMQNYKVRLIQRDFRQNSSFPTRSCRNLLRAEGRGGVCQNTEELVVAAADEDNNYCKNNYPSTVIIKDVAKAVVVHIMFFLRSLFFEL